MEPDRLLDGLNEAQRRAVTSSVVPLCILAGAGSGKTRVLTRRIAYRAATGQHDAQRVLALTFTRKAAGELSTRLRHLGLRDSVVAGTFHAVAYAQLRARWADRRVTPPTLLDRKVGFVARLLPATARGARGRDTTPLDVVAEIEWAKARQISPEQYPSAAKAANRKPSLEPRQIAAVFEKYEQEKRARRMVDFDDLLALCVRDLTNDPTFAEAQRWRYRHFFVDEFQDVNRLQHALLTAWLGDRNDLCVVGDPNQAIYTWNGADARYLLDFEERHGGGEVVRLTENYRSSPQILTAANAVLGGGLAAARARDRDPTGATGALHPNRPAGPIPTIRGLPDDTTEAQAIARSVRDHHAPGGSWRSQAILVRTNAQTAIIEEALNAVQIPFRVKGGSGLLELPEIKRALAALRASGDDFAAALTDLETAAARRGRGSGSTVGRASTIVPEVGPDLDAAEATEVDPADAGMSIAEQERLANLEALVRLGHDYAALDAAPTTTGFLTWLNATTRADQPDREGDAVEIVTFHAAKGLEWPIVHLAGVEDGFVPISYAKTPAEIAEERRLFYVAVTRAERELHITWARSRTFGTRVAERAPSPYLNQIEAARRALERDEVPDDWADFFKQARATGTTIALADTADTDATDTPPGERPTGNGGDGQGTGARVAPPRPPGFERVAHRGPPHHTAGALLDLDEQDHDLFEALKTWRADIARAGAVAPTVVLPDSALIAIAKHRPTDPDTLRALGGIGPVKAGRYGERILTLVAEHPR